MEINWLAGYRGLIDSYFEYLRKGELNPSRGLLLTHLPDDPQTELDLVAHLVQHLRHDATGEILVDWTEREQASSQHQSDFRQFFGQLWELQQQGLDETETQFYLERLNRLMAKSGQKTVASAPYVILYHLPPFATMTLEELEELRRFLFLRMEANLPIFALVRESFSDLLAELQRSSDIIWSLDEMAYPAEFYLLHPHGLRTILLQNRRRAFPLPLDRSGN